MSNNIKELLDKLIQLSQIDLQHSQVLAEKNKHIEELEQKQQQLSVLQKKVDEITAQHQERESTANNQEKHIQAEQEKLTERRKSLRTLNDYKVQQKAEKEIEHAGKLLSVQEEKLLELLDTVASLQDEKSSAETAFNEFQESLEQQQRDLEETFKNLDQRLAEYTESKESLTAGINPKDLNLYSRISTRYPGTAVVAASNSACTGCYFSLGPQVMVNISRANDLVTCQSCGRILYIEKEEEGKE